MQPRAQGIFGTIVVVAWSLQLWTGQYCSMGKFVGHGRRTRHLYSSTVLLFSA